MPRQRESDTEQDDMRMQKETSTPTARLVLVVGMWAASSPAYAYLDPGTGTMILQIILGGIAGIAVAGKLFWTQIVNFFRRSSTSSNTQTERPESDKRKPASPAERGSAEDQL